MIGPLIPLTATVVLALLLVGIGRFPALVGGNGLATALSAPAWWLIMGWAVVSLAAVLSALAGLPLGLFAASLAVIGIVGYAALVPRFALLYLAFAWLVVAPLIWIAATIPPTMFDEFAQWLPNTRYLADFGKFPDAVHPNIWSAKPAYPPAVPVLGYAVHAMTGQGADLAAKIFAPLLAASFGLILAELIANRFAKIVCVAIGVAFATVLNPFFDPRIALTAYADTPSGFVLAFLVFAGWRAAGEKGSEWTAPVAGASVLLVLLRETNIVLAVGVAIGLALTGRRGRLVACLSAIAAIATFLLWRFYVVSAAMPPTLLPRPLPGWRWDAPWLLARSIFAERLVNNRALGIGAIVVLLAIAALQLRTRMLRPPRDVLVIAASAAVVWVLFLLWCYIAVFTLDEVTRAASTWRYLSELGPTLILVCFAAFSRGSSAALFARAPKLAIAFAVAACLFPAAFTLATRAHWRIDRQYPMTGAIHASVRMLGPILGTKPVAVVHPSDAAGFAVELDYDLHRPLGSAVPVPTLDQAGHQGFAIDFAAADGAGCPSLLRWTESGWKNLDFAEPPAAAGALTACPPSALR